MALTGGMFEMKGGMAFRVPLLHMSLQVEMPGTKRAIEVDEVEDLSQLE